VRVTAVVVCWNAAPALRTCLAALDAQDHDDLEIVVVDNASTDGSREILREELQRPRRHPLRVRFNTTNRGFAGAVNDAVAEAADAEAVLVANVDIEPEPDLCSRLVDVLREDPLVGSVQPLLLRTVPGPDGRDVIDTTGHVATRARLFRNRGEGESDADRYPRGEVFGVSGALALHRRAMLEDIAWRGPEATPSTSPRTSSPSSTTWSWTGGRVCGAGVPSTSPRPWAPRARGRRARRTPQVEALNFANRLLVVATCDHGASLRRAAPLVASPRWSRPSSWP
jgi:hypothetical protein